MAATQPVFLSLNEQPDQIVRSMDELALKHSQLKGVQARTWKIVWLLLLGSLPFVCVDMLFFVLGYQVIVFSLVTGVAWVVGIVMAFRLRGLNMVEYPPYYNLARNLIYTLRDDGAPQRQFFGEVDLTGTRQDSKVARESQDALGHIVQYFRDDWLNLKIKLYDGNMLRLLAIRREKVRKSFLKRGQISGKMKVKPPKFKGELSELRLRLTANPQVYSVTTSPNLQVGTKIGIYQVTELDTSQGIIHLTALTNQNLTAENILAVMKQAYTLLKRKDFQAGGLPGINL